MPLGNWEMSEYMVALYPYFTLRFADQPDGRYGIM